MEFFKEIRSVGRDKKMKLYESTYPPRSGPQYYFRAVKEWEFNALVKTGVFPIIDSFQGIADKFEYVEKHYFGLTASHHIIEFQIIPEIDIKEEFKYANLTHKAESGTMSYGLGYNGSALVASKGGPKGGVYFMELMKARCIRWRLVSYIGTKAPTTYLG